MAVHLAVAGDVFDGVLFCAVVFPQDVLGEILNRTESVPENFPTYALIPLSETVIKKSGHRYRFQDISPAKCHFFDPAI